MKIVRYLIVYFLFVCASNVHAQINKNEFKQKFSDAEYHMLYENYSLALPIYLELFTVDPNNANINYKIGFCYLKSSSEKLKAIPFLENAIKKADKKYMEFEPTEENAPLLAYYYLGHAYHLDYKFDDAISMYQKYKDAINKRNKEEIEKADRHIAMCKNGKDLMKTPTNVIITSLGDSVNSKYPDYGPVISLDESVLIFTSRREGSTGENLTIDGQFYEDIYTTSREDGTWSKAKGIGQSINTANHEATIGLSADGQQLLIYKDDNGDGNIYVSYLDGEEWSFPQKMGSDINTKAWEPSACFSADGNTLYFVSDRKGGFGGRDIYRSVKLPNGEWSLAYNLGPNINTPYDEDAPFMHPDGKTLFFSSNGHKTMGGFDIFFASKNEEANGWNFPFNIGYPINTTDDDIFYVTSADGKRAYYSSAKEGGMGEKDIYLISFPELEAKPLTVLVGRIANPDKVDISNNLITVVDVSGNTPTTTYKANSKTGKYVLSLPPGTTYTITYEVNGNEIYTETLDLPAGTEYQMLQREIKLKPVEVTEDQAGADPKEETKTPETKTSETKDPNKEKEKPADPAIASNEARQFQMFFNYNNKTLKSDNSEFNAFVESVSKETKEGKKPVITIEASASKVPTATYGSNEKLASARGETAKEELAKALDAKGVSKENYSIKVVPKVQGPKYNNDYIENRSQYEKFQYIRMSVK